MKDHANAAAERAQAFAVQLHHIGAVHRQCAVRDVMHAVDGADQRGFASAGKADDGHELALSNGQVNVLQRLEAVGVFFVYMFEFNHLINLTLSKKGGSAQLSLLFCITRCPSVSGKSGGAVQLLDHFLGGALGIIVRGLRGLITLVAVNGNDSLALLGVADVDERLGESGFKIIVHDGG